MASLNLPGYLREMQEDRLHIVFVYQERRSLQGAGKIHDRLDYVVMILQYLCCRPSQTWRLSSAVFWLPNEKTRKWNGTSNREACVHVPEQTPQM
jgi:hypothetical protein